MNWEVAHMRSLVGLIVTLISGSSFALDFGTAVPIREKGAVTYYVGGQITGYGETEFMIDTGSGYVALNAETIDKLKKQGLATFSKTIIGVMADGAEQKVKIYRIGRLNIGGACVIDDVEAAVLPRGTRNILGLSALKKTAPFGLSMDPPQLILSNCKVETAV